MINYLDSNLIKIGSPARNKDELLNEIAELAKQSPVLADIEQDVVLNALKEREKLVSTGLEKGIAIPHCSFDGLSSFVVGFICLPEGIDFESFDGEKSKLIFFIIGPSEKRNKHIKILSSISRLSKDDLMREKLLKCQTAEDLSALLANDSESGEIDAIPNKCQFLIHIQQEELFQNVLEILTSEVEGSVSVLEASSASSHLHRLPLFSTFWNDGSKGFAKIIVAVIEKKLMNDVIRRINMVRGNSNEGMLISVSELLYSDGSIDF